MFKKFLVLISGVAFISMNAFAFSGENNMTNTNKQKVLIAYYSRSGNTKQIAEKIQSATGGDLYEITINHTYPSEYNLMTEQAKKEITEGFRPELTGKPIDFSQYDMVFIGSPNWWGTITPAVSSFLEQSELAGKKVVPFITHGGGGEQNTVKDMTDRCKGCSMQKAWTGYGATTTGFDSWMKSVLAQ